MTLFSEGAQTSTKTLSEVVQASGFRDLKTLPISTGSKSSVDGGGISRSINVG